MADTGSNTGQVTQAKANVTKVLDRMDQRLTRAGELSTEIVTTLSIQDVSAPDGAVPQEARVTELDGRMGRVRDQMDVLDRVIQQLEYIAEEVHKV